MANVMLADGRDISDKVSVMYDISGWSLGRLWGATVDTVRTSSSKLSVPDRAVDEAANVGYVAPRGTLRLRLDDAREIAALNSLLADGVSVRRAADGSAIVPASARAKAVALAKKYDVAFDATKATGTTPLHRVRVAAAVTPGELFALREMNFDVVPVSTAILNAGFDWSRADVLFASVGPEPRGPQHGRTRRSGRLPGTAWAWSAAEPPERPSTPPPGCSPSKPVEGNGDANGVVRVVNSGGGVTSGAPDHSFVYAPLWFTDLGPGVRVEQSYAAGNPLVSGHWRALEDGSGGPAQAGGPGLGGQRSACRPVRHRAAVPRSSEGAVPAGRACFAGTRRVARVAPRQAAPHVLGVPPPPCATTAVRRASR